jgi:hypothetical protein
LFAGSANLQAQRRRRKGAVVDILTGNDTTKTAQASESKTPQDAPTRASGSPPIFFLRDNSKIAGFPKEEALEVQTKYGKLTVPRDQLVRIRFARRLRPGLRERIGSLIADIGDEDYDIREGATEELRAIGPPILGQLKRSIKSNNEEVKNRAEILINEIDVEVKEKKLEVEDSLPHLAGTEDEIVTETMTIMGTAPQPQFFTESPYGELNVATSDLSDILFRSVLPSSKKVSVSANYQPPGTWFDNKFELQKGQTVKIEASGQATVSNYGLTSGPTGNKQYGIGSFGGFPMLALVGKIGKKGKPFLIGTSYSDKARKAGRLYVGITPFTHHSSGESGSYNLKIHAYGSE